MGEKKKNNDGENKKKGDDGEKKKNNESITVVLKVDMHCEGCASRIVKCVRSFEGVETVKSEAAAGKLTVTGTVDPAKLRDKLQMKTKKKIDLVSPQPKKDKENAKDNKKNEDDDKNKAKKADDKKSDSDKKPKEKEKEPPVMTAVLKLNFHCQGCIGKIQKTVTKTKGVDAISMDSDKQQVTVKGTMDVKKLSETLSEKLRRPVEIVPPAKKDKGNEKDNDAGDGGKKKKGGAGGDGGGNKEEGASKMEYLAPQPGSGFGYGYGNGYGHYQYPVQAHAPQIFSDENPNACAVM